MAATRVLSLIPSVALVACSSKSVVHHGTKLVLLVKESLWLLYVSFASLLVSLHFGEIVPFSSDRSLVPQSGVLVT